MGSDLGVSITSIIMHRGPFLDVPIIRIGIHVGLCCISAAVVFSM